MNTIVETYGPRDIKRIFGFRSDSTLSEWIKRGTIPEPKFYNKRVRRWPKAPIDAIAAAEQAA